jgi:hypothetical protein
MQSLRDLDAVLNAVCEEPRDVLNKMAVADYYRDEGDELRAQAWMALVGKEPVIQGVRPVVYWWYTTYFGVDKKHTLPKEWIYCINGHERKAATYNFGLLDAFLEAVEGYVVWKSGGK